MENIAKPLLSNIKGSFAYKTVNERWPKIITKVIDQLHRNFYKLSVDNGEECGKQVTTIISKISEMKYRMETNKPLIDFEGKADWENKWNIQLDKVRSLQRGEEKTTWYDTPWLFVECYLYSKLHEFVTCATTLLDYDIFEVEKQKAYYDSEVLIKGLLCELKIWEEEQNSDIKTALKRLLQISLWGNKCDLSLSSGDPHVIAENIFHSLDELSESILVNDLDRTVDYIINNCKDKEIHIVLDNAGLELVTDLAVGEFIINKKLAKRIVFHGKAYPWFVSDVTPRDFKWVLETMKNSNEADFKKFGQRWQEREEFYIRYEPFWTTCHSFWEIKDEDPQLFKDLQASGLVIFKGDLNYRKLVNDRDWPIDTNFKFALQSLSTVPLFVLRTLKAETVAGLSKKSVDFIKQKYGDNDLSWMTSSEYAVAQLNLN